MPLTLSRMGEAEESFGKKIFATGTEPPAFDWTSASVLAETNTGPRVMAAILYAQKPERLMG